ncbi:MAG TPA: DUF2950 domain-containing protein [Candidatus Acidoferrales bacterium]|nr:DUF2950 domain-containing protein [Candidatus Acidoferrales bacterium]
MQWLTMAGLAWLSSANPLLAQTTNAGSMERFGAPEAAIQALRAAAEAGDRSAIERIFGPEVNDFLTGDKVQDAANFRGFSRAISDRCNTTADGENRLILNIGTNDWPFPIPLVKQQDGQWFFDTDAGREEIIDRHIGRDELNAIGVCRAFVRAQKEYFAQENGAEGTHQYAEKFKSSPGQHDGLYWPSSSGPSPFGALVAEAFAEGYGNHPAGTGPHPFHGYCFRILTAQGRAAPGGKCSYLVDGKLTRGFALVAYPDKWGRSGIMTFIVNQDGKVYQRNYGERTSEVASSMTRYDPTRHWALVEDPGVNEP